MLLMTVGGRTKKVRKTRRILLCSPEFLDLKALMVGVVFLLVLGPFGLF
jgi:hypothetical protein